VLVLIGFAAAASADPQQLFAKNAALYEEVCLNAFPDDKAVEALMTAREARPLSEQDVKITMRDDPARAWELDDGTTVWIEFPPYHACSVRWSSTSFPDTSPYRAVADRYEQRQGGFTAADPYDSDVDDIHVHAVADQKQLQDGSWETLFLFDQQITDPARRANGETGYSLRFVHQYAPPERP
jgi:hypothetical protein